MGRFMPVAEAKRMTLTDTVEEGLWLWLYHNEKEGLPTQDDQLRFVVSRLPRYQKKLTLSFLVYMSHPRESELEELFRDHLERFFEKFYNDPACIDGLQRLNAVFPAAVAKALSPKSQAL